MFRMAVGHSQDPDPDGALEEVLAQCALALNGVQPATALMLCTYEIDPRELISGVGAAYPGVSVVGSTSCAELSSVLGFQEGSVVLAVFGSDSADVTAGLGTGVVDDPEGAARVAVAEARAGTGREPRLCVVASAYTPFPLRVIDSVREAVGGGVPVIGGISSATLADPSAALQFRDDRVVNDGVAVLLLSGDLAVSMGVDHGWRPVGKRGRVTRATPPDSVDEIDGRPAIEFYERYLGQGSGAPGSNPLVVFEDERGDDFYLRAAAGWDQATGSLVISGGLPEGATVQLGMATTDEIFGGTRSALEKALRGFPEGATPEAGLIFSCMVRKLLLGTRIPREIEIARDLWGEALPVCGFYSMGEIAPLGSGTDQYHNTTIVAVVLGTA